MSSTEKPLFDGFHVNPLYAPGHTYPSHAHLVAALKAGRVKPGFAKYCRELAQWVRTQPEKELLPWQASYRKAVFG